MGAGCERTRAPRRTKARGVKPRVLAIFAF